MAEFLIRAKGHWMDNLSNKEVKALSPSKKASYDARTELGDIVVVKPDGWKWGRAECPPDFIIVKVFGISAESVNHYLYSIYEGEDSGKLLKFRRYKIPESFVNYVLSQTDGIISIGNSQLTQNIIDKVT